MASSRPASMILSSNSSASDETMVNGSKTMITKKELIPMRPSNQSPKIPVNAILHTNSSSSSIDSTGAKNAIFTGKEPSLPINTNVTVSTTTTDSDLESEQDERSIDDSSLCESNNTSVRIQQQQEPLLRRNGGKQKTGLNSQEQLSRRVKHFQKLFRSEIQNDDMPELIDSYVCAYQGKITILQLAITSCIILQRLGDILLQGKMYITDRYLCFHSRIISYVTKHVYRWEQIENVTKERVAFIFPTAIGIQLKGSGKKIIYASFLQRDQAFDKISDMCSRFNNDTNSIADDDDSRTTQNGTLKAINSSASSNGKVKKMKRDITYNVGNELEQEDVLQMCLTPNTTNNNNNNKRRPQPALSKSSDKKQQVKQSHKSNHSDKTKKPNDNQDLLKSFPENVSDNNEANADSKSASNQAKESDTKLNNSTVGLRQSRNIPLRVNRSPSREPVLSLINSASSDTLGSNSPSNSGTDTGSSVVHSSANNGVEKYSRIIILSLISIIKIIIEYSSLLFNRLKTYPIKTSMILLIFILILIVHSFYLINLAYRIEDRLQSLNKLWPTSSLMKDARQL